jgi:hypothetical protein
VTVNALAVQAVPSRMITLILPVAASAGMVILISVAPFLSGHACLWTTSLLFPGESYALGPLTELVRLVPVDVTTLRELKRTSARSDHNHELAVRRHSRRMA